MTNQFIVNTRFSLPDIRDIRYAPRLTPDQFKSSLDLLPNVEEVEDQGEAGTCVANAAISMCEWLANSHGHHVDLSRMFAYVVCKIYEGRLLEDGLGTRDIFKTLRRYGVMDEALFPYDISRQYTAPSGQDYAAADKFLQRYEAVIPPTSTNWVGDEPNDKINMIKACLNEGFPVGIAFMVTSSIRTMIGPWRTHNYVRESSQLGGNPIGGHCMTIIGYDDNVQRFLVQNSWGPEWGDGGFGGFPYGIVSEAFCEAWMVRTFNNWGLREPAGIFFEEANRFNITARIVPTDEELGTTTNVWVGARRPDPLSLDGYGPLLIQAPNRTWVPATTAIPVFQTITLQEDNPILAVSIWDEAFTGLAPYSGTLVYLAYGQDSTTWKHKLLCKVPHYG